MTDCLDGGGSSLVPDDTAAVAAQSDQIGIAMDGHAMFPSTLANGSEPGGLGECHGHEAVGLPYDYHVGAAGSNQIPG